MNPRNGTPAFADHLLKVTDRLQGLRESDADYMARLSDNDLRVMARRYWNEPDGPRLRAARAEAKKRGITVA